MKLSMLIFVSFGALALAAGCGDRGEERGDGRDRAAVDETPAPTAGSAAEKPAPAPAAAKAPMAFDAKPPVGTKATCPVMKGEFVVSETTDHSEFEGKHYAFCCPGCKPQFDADPKKFIDG